MEFEDWLKLGTEKGWVVGPVCSTHDGIPMTKDEEAAWEEGLDPCVHILRLCREGEAEDVRQL